MTPINPKPQRTIRRRPRLEPGGAGGIECERLNLSIAASATAPMRTSEARNGISLIAIGRGPWCTAVSAHWYTTPKCHRSQVLWPPIAVQCPALGLLQELQDHLGLRICVSPPVVTPNPSRLPLRFDISLARGPIPTQVVAKQQMLTLPERIPSTHMDVYVSPPAPQMAGRSGASCLGCATGLQAAPVVG